MTTTTPDTVLIPTPEAPEAPGVRRSSTRLRFAVAFLVGLLASMAIGVGALYAYDRQYTGRILPGVAIGSLDLSGMDAVAAAAAIRQVYGYLGEGSITFTTRDSERTISFADIGRGPDVDAMVAEALAVGRDGNAVERIIADARTALRGVALTPKVTFDADALAEHALDYADTIAREPRDAWVALVAKQFAVVNSVDGRLADPAIPVEAALADLGELGAPADLRYEMPVQAVPPTVTTDEATQAKYDAERIAQPILFAGKADDQKITTGRLRNWLTFGPTADGGYDVSIDTTGLEGVLKSIAKKVDKAPVNASYTTSGARITGVTQSKVGFKMDLEATRLQVQELIDARIAGAGTTTVEPTIKVTQPRLTTEEAQAARPKMRRISQWTTYFPISEKNGFGANIWIPARLINGYVVAPGATFDFWNAVGSVTRAKGYRSGGAIINGRTEPQGALAGGICSCSTTLFNAAARAGYKIGARRNHYYYIDRYPVGLDATVFISASGSTQTMSFTNDTDYPLLIRGLGWREGGRGYVKFEIYSVPTGRKVSFATGAKRNYRPASDTIEYTSSLPTGASKRIEYPVAGFQVSVTRTVRDKSGKVIHKNTWFSNYARITGITLVGR
jgi:vancomycin resistance protein YoaR